MTWTVQIAGHKADDDQLDYADVNEAVRELVRKLRHEGHTVDVHTVNDRDVEAQ
jgi:hypothetical protein